MGTFIKHETGNEACFAHIVAWPWPIPDEFATDAKIPIFHILPDLLDEVKSSACM